MKTIVVGTAGHIDHGKSALVQALTGTDPDRLKEEKARGITIDLGFAHAAIGDLNVAFVDVPGHERFVRNMLAGAGAIHAVLLVIAANESVMPQTREHFEICRLLGLERGAIVLTKTDIADADMIAVASEEARELVAGSFLARAPIVSVSARTGAGLDELRAALLTLGRAPAAAPRATPRLPIDRVFTIKGFGTVVTGTLVSGRVTEDDELVVLPEGRRVRVRGVQVHGRSAPHVDAPNRLAVNLGAIDVSDLSRGMTLSVEDGVSVTRRADVHLELLESARGLHHGARVHVHHGTSDLTARVGIAAVRTSAQQPWRPIGLREAAVSIPSGGEGYVRLRFDRPAVLTRGDRLVIRAESPAMTIGGGAVLDPEPPLAGLRRANALQHFEALSGHFVDVWLDAAGVRGLDANVLARRGGLDREDARRLFLDLAATDRVVMVGDRAFSAAIVGALEARAIATLEQFHRAHPAEPGLARESVRTSGPVPPAPALFDAVVSRLVGARAIVGNEVLALASYKPVTVDGEGESRARIVGLIREAGLMPPDLAAIASATRRGPPEVERWLHALVKERVLVRLGTLVFHPQPLAALRADIKDQALAGPTAEVDVSTFKNRYGLSRKFAIPLLEWLDRERVTRRVGNTRRVL